MSTPLPPSLSLDFQLPQAASAGSESPACLCGDGHNGLVFKDILAEASTVKDVVAELKQVLSEEQLAELKDLLESGNGLPLSAIFSHDTELTAELVEEIEQLGQMLAQLPQQLQEAAKQEGLLGSSLIATAKKLSDGLGNLGKDLPSGLQNLGQQIKDTLAPVLDQSSNVVKSAQDVLSSFKSELPTLDISIKNPLPTVLVNEVSGQSQPNINATLSGITQFSNIQQSSGPAMPTPVTAPLSDKGFGEAMGERIMWMVGKNMQAASIRINPPNLGPVHVQLSVQNDQTSVNMIVQHGVVKEAMEAAIPRLREMLAESNMQLVNVDVSQRETASHNGSSELSDHSQRQDDNGYMSEDESLSPDSEELVVHYASDRLLDDYA